VSASSATELWELAVGVAAVRDGAVGYGTQDQRAGGVSAAGQGNMCDLVASPHGPASAAVRGRPSPRGLSMRLLPGIGLLRMLMCVWPVAFEFHS
jgi:hypothetical protein